MKNKIFSIGLIALVSSFWGCGGGGSSSNKVSITPAEVTKENANEVAKVLILNPIDFSKVKYNETGKSVEAKFLKISTYPCTTGSVEIERSIDTFNIENFLSPRENILTYKECQNQYGELFDGKIKLNYIPLFPKDIELSQITEQNAIKFSDKNVSILEDYTYQNNQYKIEIKKGSRFESVTDKETSYRSEKLSIDAIEDINRSYKIESLKSRIYQKENIKRVCFREGRVYINNNRNYFDLQKDDLCRNEFVWVNRKLQGGGEVKLKGADNQILTLIATDQNEITAYLNDEELGVIDTTQTKE